MPSVVRVTAEYATDRTTVATPRPRLSWVTESDTPGWLHQNLKRAADMQLSAAQQDTVSQTRQFMEQSKAAMAAGDFERARTFAWKAQLLSEDLAKPEK